ncbi:MAG: ABC transporter permease [Chloroflexota bacterium]|nr:ABC transporter permease [Chloroflexota bacterium]
MNALTIARFTIHEAVSRRLVLAALVLSAIFLALFALGFMMLYGMVVEEVAQRPAVSDDQELVLAPSLLTVLGLYAVHFLSSFLALFLTVNAISGEIDSGTLHAVLARPIRRVEFILGRWLAYVAMIGAYVGGMAGLIFAIAFAVAGYQPVDAPRTLVLMALGAVLLLSVSLFGSSILSTLANGVVVFTLFGLAWLGGIVEFIGTLAQNGAMVNLGIVVSLLVPSDGVWKAASFYAQSPAFVVMASAQPVGIPFFGSTPPAGPFLVWAGVYPLVFLLFAVRAFSKRDL